MDNKILPNEFYVKESGVHVIQTRCPKHNVTDQMIHQRVLAAELMPGDMIRVQCMNHDRTAVHWFAEYLVYDRSSEIKRVEVNDRDIRHVDDVKYSVMRVTDWKSTPAVLGGKDIKLHWNLGKKMHEVKLGDDVIFEHSDKEAVEKFMGDYGH